MAASEQTKWVPLGKGRELALRRDGDGLAWAAWRVRRGLRPVLEIVELPPPSAEETARRFTGEAEAIAHFAALAPPIPGTSRAARAASPLGKAARRL